MRIKRPRGFTLVELLVVITIIGILIALLLLMHALVTAHASAQTKNADDALQAVIERLARILRVE